MIHGCLNRINLHLGASLVSKAANYPYISFTILDGGPEESGRFTKVSRKLVNHEGCWCPHDRVPSCHSPDQLLSHPRKGQPWGCGVCRGLQSSPIPDPFLDGNNSVSKCPPTPSFTGRLFPNPGDQGSSLFPRYTCELPPAWPLGHHLLLVSTFLSHS